MIFQIVNKTKSAVLLLLTFCFLAGCKKFVTIDPPPTSLSDGNVYSNDITASSVMIGIYDALSAGTFDFQGYSVSGTYVTAGLMSDELTLFDINNTTWQPFYQNAFSAATGGGVGPWFNAFSNQGIFTCNAVIEGVSASPTITPSVKQQLVGEAKFMRAFFYFYLTNFYGKVPIVLSTDPKKNALLPRSSVDSVYAQIIADLKEAKGLLNANYLGANAKSVTSERVRPNKWSATALLARAYLYHKDYDSAFATATEVINSGSYDLLSNLNDVFLMNSREAIWQLQAINVGQNANTGEGGRFVLPDVGPDTWTYPVYLNKAILNSFEAGDNRKTKWIDSVVVGTDVFYYPYKYKSGVLQNNTITEYSMVLRLAEQYLIRAEAAINKSSPDLNAAVSDLNKIRNRAGLPNYSGSVSKDALMAALLRERRNELFTEWGHRWFDLKRWPGTTLSDVMIPAAQAKGATWNPNNYQALYPIAQQEILVNPHIDQNLGY